MSTIEPKGLVTISERSPITGSLLKKHQLSSWRRNRMSVRSVSPLPELRIYVTPMPLPRGKVPALGEKSQSIV